MFTLNYILSNLKKYKVSTIATISLIAITSLLITLGSAASNSVREGNKQALKPFEKIGTDITLVRHVDKAPDIFAENLPSGIHKNGLSVYFKEEKENKTSSTKTFSTVGIPLAVASTFNKEEINKIKTFPQVEKVSSLLMAYYSYYSVEEQKIVLPEEEIKPKEIKISIEESRELEEQVNADPEVQQIDKEMKIILNKKEWEWTENDKKTYEELVDKIGMRKQELYYKLRPDIFPAPPKRERKVIEPPPPKETLREFYIAGMDPNVGYLKSEDILIGRYFTNSDQSQKVAILRKDFAEKNKIALGNKLKLIDTEYEVIGISWPSLAVNAPEVFLPLNSLQNQLSAQGMGNVIFIKAKSSSDVPKIKEQLSKEFPNAEINANNDLSKIVKPSMTGSMELLAKFNNLISATLSIIACIIVTLLATFTLNKRQKETAILGAIGWPSYKVSLYLVSDIIIKIILGLILGLIISFLMVPILGQENVSLISSNNMYNAANFFGYLAGKVPSNQVAPLNLIISMKLTAVTLAKTTIITLLLGAIVGLILSLRIRSIKTAEVLRRP